MGVSRDETMVLDAETVARYRSDGAVCIRNALQRKWIEAIEKVRKTKTFIEVSFSRRGVCNSQVMVGIDKTQRRYKRYKTVTISRVTILPVVTVRPCKRPPSHINSEIYCSERLGPKVLHKCITSDSL